MKLGDIIGDYREVHGITMQEFADRCGLSKGYISMLEKGRRPGSETPIIPSINTFSAVAKAMRMTTDDLLAIVDPDQVISLSEAVESCELSQSESALLEAFGKLNVEGQERVLSYIEDLLASGRYIKSDSVGMVSEA